MSDKKGLGKTSMVLMVLVVLAVATITTGVARAATAKKPKKLGASKLPQNSKIRIMTILDQFRNKHAC